MSKSFAQMDWPARSRRVLILEHRIEIGGIRRKQPQLRAGCLDFLTHAGNSVSREIVHRHDLTWRERRHKTLFEISKEDLAIHRGIDDERSGHAMLSQASDKRRHLPVAVRNLGDEPFPARAASTQPGHVGRSAGLIDEDELARIKPRLLSLPVRACRADVFARLFGCVQAFF